MDKLRITGGRPLNGVIEIGGAKNAALPLMAASLLTDDCLALGNLPHVSDIATMTELLVELGVDISMNGNSDDASRETGGSEGRLLLLSARNLVSRTAPYDLVRKMRASVLVLGPLLARAGHARVSMPGGCAIGLRPVDLHVSGLRQLGAEISLQDGYIEATARSGLVGANIVFPTVSVGATANLMMAACLARGETTITNAACEPEIVDLANCLSQMGANIGGAETGRIKIFGVDRLCGAEHKVLPDRIETGTYAIAAAITGGTLDLIGTTIDLIQTVADTLRAVGIELTVCQNGVRVQQSGNRLGPVNIETRPYPGFPTDMQAQIMALMTVSTGISTITENIFENRFMHVTELSRMGADILVKGNSAMVRGVPSLRGAPVMATDLRASVSLLLAGLAAEGETIVNRLYHLDRGYERVEEKLARCGAQVERM